MAITWNTIKGAWSVKKNLSQAFIRKNERWAFLDGYKAIGIFWVILGHTILSTQDHFGLEEWSRLIRETPFYLQWIFSGDIAVDVFLMITGFLMTNILLKSYQEKKILNVKVFYLSRFLRLSPAYFLALLIVMVSVDTSGKNIWPNFFYIQNFFNDYDRYFLPYTWSLAVEEQFYLLLPAYLYFVLLKSKSPLSHLIFALLASFLIRTWIILSDDIENIKELVFNHEFFNHYFVAVYDNLYTRFGAFIPGVTIAYLYRYRPEASLQLVNSKLGFYITFSLMLIMVIFFAIPVYMQGFEMSHGLTLTILIVKRNVICICCAWLVYCGLFDSNNARRFNQFMSSKFFYPFGTLLYSMYLFHILAVNFVLGNMKYNFRLFNIDFMQHLELWIFFAAALSFILSTIIATITYLLIESPVMNLRPKMSA